MNVFHVILRSALCIPCHCTMYIALFVIRFILRTGSALCIPCNCTMYIALFVIRFILRSALCIPCHCTGSKHHRKPFPESGILQLWFRTRYERVLPASTSKSRCVKL